jgi:hypothetical protein
MNALTIDRTSWTPQRSPSDAGPPRAGVPPDFQVHAHELLMERAPRQLLLLGHARHRRIEAQSSLDADHQRVQHVRQRVQDRPLPLLDPVVQPEVREHEPEREAAERYEQRVREHPLDEEAEEG